MREQDTSPADLRPQQSVLWEQGTSAEGYGILVQVLGDCDSSTQRRDIPAAERRRMVGIGHLGQYLPWD